MTVDSTDAERSYSVEEINALKHELAELKKERSAWYTTLRWMAEYGVNVEYERSRAETALAKLLRKKKGTSK
jgi:hypothetical protein